ncbi:MAG: hypothetical protein Q8O67_24000 [Deltaproteobacteria bacterium]|nr:hypothetical protein [Deltaproteobacteria bacterium]
MAHQDVSPKTVVAIIAGAAVLYVIVAAVGVSQKPVHLVSGVAHPYDVVVDGQSVTLAPGGRQTLTLGLGQHTLRTTSPAGVVTIEIFDNSASSFLTAPMALTREHVVNPDRCAAVVVETQVYRTTTPLDDDYSWEVRTGEVFYDVDADFAFEPFPDSVKTKGSSATKRRVALPDDGVFDAPSWIAEKLGRPAALTHLERRIAFDPLDGFAIHELATADPAALLVATRWLLDDRPTATEAWLAFLAARDDDDDDDALLALLAEKPDACAWFVRSLLLEEPASSEAFARAAKEGCENATSKQAVRAVVAGTIAEAEHLIANAVPSRLTPSRVWAHRTALLGSGHADRWLAWQEANGAPDVDVAVTAIRAAAARGDKKAAADLLKAHLQQIAVEGAAPKRVVTEARELEAATAYAFRDVAALITLVAEHADDLEDGAVYSFELDLISGKIDDAIEEFDDFGPANRALLAAAALRHKHPKARALVDGAAADLKATEVGPWLSKEPTVAEVRAIDLNIASSRAIAALLAERWPASKEWRAEAERLAFGDELPALFVAQGH